MKLSPVTVIALLVASLFDVVLVSGWAVTVFVVGWSCWVLLNPGRPPSARFKMFPFSIEDHDLAGRCLREGIHD